MIQIPYPMNQMRNGIKESIVYFYQFNMEIYRLSVQEMEEV